MSHSIAGLVGNHTTAPGTALDGSAGEAVTRADALDPAAIRRGAFLCVNFAPGRVRATLYDGDERRLLCQTGFGPGHSEHYGRGRVLVAAELVRRLMQELAALALDAERQGGEG